MPDSSKLDLLCQLPHTANLQQLCDLAFQIMGNPIFISDMAHTILAYTKCVEIDDPTWQENIVAAHLDSNTLKQNREVGSVHITSAAIQRPVLVQDDYIPYARIIKTLTRHSQAVVVLPSFLQPLGDQDPELLDLISAFILPKLVQERFHLTSDSRSVENYFIKLLDEDQPSREKIDRHLDSLGFQMKPYTYVVALCLSDAPGQTPSGTKNLEQIQQEFAQTLHCPVLIYNALLLCIYGSDTPVHRWPEDVAGMAELLRRWNLLAGISRAALGVGLGRAHGLLDHVHLLHDNAGLLGHRAQHLAGLAAVLAGDDLDGVALADRHLVLSHSDTSPTAFPVPETRSSCTSCRAARERRARRYGCRAGSRRC